MVLRAILFFPSPSSGRAGWGSFFARFARGPHPALPEDGEGDPRATCHTRLPAKRAVIVSPCAGRSAGIECMTVTEQTPVPAVATPAAPQREVMYRHSIVVRATHWINAVCLALLLMSGLRIFNSHPSLYWGNYGYRGVPPFISITATEDSETDELTGITRIGPWRFETTGVLGVSADADGDPAAMAFPNWITLPGGPGLALARDRS